MGSVGENSASGRRRSSFRSGPWFADVDGDGLDDIVVTSISESGDKVGWFRQKNGESESWEEMPIRVNLPPIIGVDAGDVDLDGDLDLVCASEHASRPFLLINADGKGTGWKRDSIRVESPDSVRRWVARFSDKPLSQVHARFADLDGDGDLDCVETSLQKRVSGMAGAPGIRDGVEIP